MTALSLKKRPTKPTSNSRIAMPSKLSATTFPFICVYNDDEKNPYFHLTVQDALNKINSQPVGNSLLKTISGAKVVPGNGGFKIKIVRPDVTATIGKPGAEGGNRALPFNELNARGDGGGCLVACYWNPNIYNTPGAAGARPAFVGLAHELIHCMHALLGTMKVSDDDEEKFTVGLAPYDDAAICENTIRAEHGINTRNAY
jgi:hypothetical protein